MAGPARKNYGYDLWWELRVWCHRAWYSDPYWTQQTFWSPDFLQIASEIHLQQALCDQRAYALRLVFEIEQYAYWPTDGEFEPRSYV